MKIFFAGSIRAGRNDQELYFATISELKKYGVVLTEQVGTKDLAIEMSTPTQSIYNREMGRLKEADILIAEITTPSLGVGYELGQAQAMGKRIVCLYRESIDKSLSAMISGNPDIKLFTYNRPDDLTDIFKSVFV